MEALVFALTPIRNGYNHQEAIVPESPELQPFDLLALKQSYDAGNNSSSRLIGRKRSLPRSGLASSALSERR